MSKISFYHKTVFYEVLEAWSRSESLEIAIKSRMQNMVHFENMNIIFVSEILFEIFYLIIKFGA